MYMYIIIIDANVFDTKNTWKFHWNTETEA